MINLLPPDIKENLVYARRNTRMRKWSIALFMSMVGILLVVAVGHVYLRQSIQAYEKQVEQTRLDLKAQKIEDTQKQVQDLTDSLKLVVQVLQREILFSKLLTKVGATLPGGSVLTDLSINKVQGGIDLQAGATDYQTATQVQLNLQDPANKIFDKADIVSIECPNTTNTSGDPVKNKYPCTVQIRALFAKNNSFSFIDTSKASGATP